MLEDLQILLKFWIYWWNACCKLKPKTIHWCWRLILLLRKMSHQDWHPILFAHCWKLQTDVRITNQIVFTINPYLSTILSMWTNFTEVEHRHNSLDYRPLINVINQLETSHHYCKCVSRCLRTSWQVCMNVLESSHL